MKEWVASRECRSGWLAESEGVERVKEWVASRV